MSDRDEDVVEPADVGSLERGRGASFCLEPRCEFFFGDLQGDDAFEAGVAGTVDVAHAAGSEKPEDFIGADAGSRRKRTHAGIIEVTPARLKPDTTCVQEVTLL